MGKVRVQRSAVRVTAKSEAVPELRDGDRMSKAEFWRRYEASKTVHRAELIQGVVHVISAAFASGEEPTMAPISNDGHGFPHSDLMYWLATYAHATAGVRSGGPGTIRGSDDNTSPEPDAILMIRAEFGGRTRSDAAGYLVQGPELIAEISNTTTQVDLGTKLQANQTDGVPEYFVWRTRHQVIDWFHLNRRGEYAPLIPDAEGTLKSRVFPGLWLDPVAMTGGDMARVLAVVQQGIASPEHIKFVEKLRKRAAKKKR